MKETIPSISALAEISNFAARVEKYMAARYSREGDSTEGSLRWEAGQVVRRLAELKANQEEMQTCLCDAMNFGHIPDMIPLHKRTQTALDEFNRINS